MTTLREMVQDVKRELLGANRERYATFTGWVTSGGNKIGLTLADLPQNTVGAQSALASARVELDTEIVYVTSVDLNGTATCPAWFRQQDGTPLNDSFASGSRVIINPQWPTYTVVRKVVEGIQSLYPNLFAVKETDLTTSMINGNYQLPSDVDGVLHVTYEVPGSTHRQFVVNQWSLDTKNSDGFSYLRTNPAFPERPLRVTYRAKPVVPDPTNLAATWASTLLPDSAVDLPVKYAVMCLLPSQDAAKLQTNSVEQSDRNKYVQGGTANATSRRLQEISQARLVDERRKLLDRYPVRIHKELNG